LLTGNHLVSDVDVNAWQSNEQPHNSSVTLHSSHAQGRVALLQAINHHLWVLTSTALIPIQQTVTKQGSSEMQSVYWQYLGGWRVATSLAASKAMSVGCECGNKGTLKKEQSPIQCDSTIVGRRSTDTLSAALMSMPGVARSRLTTAAWPREDANHKGVWWSCDPAATGGSAILTRLAILGITMMSYN
jgi:hypothetical protein